MPRRLKRKRGKLPAPKPSPTCRPLQDGNLKSTDDIDPSPSAKRIKTDDKENAPLPAEVPKSELSPVIPAIETIDLSSKDEPAEDGPAASYSLFIPQVLCEKVKAEEVVKDEKGQDTKTPLPSETKPKIQSIPTPGLEDRDDNLGSSLQHDVEEEQEENPEDEALNAAFRRVERSSMQDFNNADTEWMDNLIHNRPSANSPRSHIDPARQAEINREDLMAYLAAVDNRPGYVRRKNKPTHARKSSQSFTSGTGTSLVGESLSKSPEERETHDAPVNQAPGDVGEQDEEEVHIKEEQERIAEAARSLRCKCRRRRVTRRELLEDVTAVNGDMTLDTSTLGGSEETLDEERVIIADGPDGQPRRYRLMEEIRKFWTVRGMETPLLDHQILGVEWMVKVMEQAEQPPRGGLLCDQMGLGKTMQVIATMVLNKPPEDIGYRGPKVTLIITPAALMQQWKNEIQMHTKPGTFKVTIHHGSQKIKTLSMLKNQDIVITSYNTIMFSHPSPKRPRRDMSHEEVEEWWEQEWESRGIFHRMKFWRICLDESHWIKNHRSRMSAASTSLRAVHKWSISGTPIQNSLQDMYAQFRFLDHPRFGDLPSFRKVFGVSMSGGAARAAKAMQVELSRLMMRRTKEEKLCGRKLLDLTPKIISTTEVDFGPEERNLYRVYEEKTISEVNRLRRAGRGADNFFLSALALLMRLRQICDSPFLILESIKKHMTLEDLKQVLVQSALDNKESPDDDELPSGVTNAFGTPRKRRKVEEQPRGLRQILELAKVEPAGDSSQCSICLDAPEDPVLTNCRHCFCQECIANVIQNAAVQGTPSVCPLCKNAVAVEDLRAYVQGFGAQGEDTNDEALPPEAALDNKHWLEQAKTLIPSAKMAAIKAQLQDWKENRPDDKIIIFSQFTKMLDLVYLMCEKQGWETTRYQGGTSMKTREEALKRFKTDPDCWIMLTSLRAGGVGLNLTEANLVLSIDMWWNAAVEHQAFDRVHRLGQRKEVFVKRLMVKKTVEQRILALQEAKLKIFDAAMGEGLGRVKNLSIKELMGLFGKVIMGEDGIEMVVQD